MHLTRLDLIAYGHFTGRSIVFPEGIPNLHIVFGPNEAGKSTALSAIEDFLFGIDPRSKLNFLHAHPDMRIGARLQTGGQTLDAVRRKGKKDTLLGLDGMPLPAGEAALAPFLGGADRAFMERMFSLDHLRLREGGAAILAARDDAGETLLSAGTGLGGLGAELKALEAEADAIWGPRRSERRAHTQAMDRLRAAEETLRDQTVTAKDWQALEAAQAAAQAAVAREAEATEGLRAEYRRLGRIRRVYRDARRLSELDAALPDLGDSPTLPQDALAQWNGAREAEGTAAAQGDLLEKACDAARAAHDALLPDAALLDRAGDIGALHEQRIEVRAGRSDLPNREAELATAEADLARLAGDLGWQDGNAAALIPPRADVVRLHGLIRRRGGIIVALRTAEEAVEEAEAEIRRIEAQLGEAGPGADAEPLRAALSAAPVTAELRARLRTAEEAAEAAQATIGLHLAALRPEVAGDMALAAIAAPPRTSVVAARDRFREIRARVETAAERLRVAGRELAQSRSAHARALASGGTVPLETLRGLRAERDAAWLSIRDRVQRGEPVDDAETAVFEAAIAAADAAADRRFDTAEAAAALAALARQVALQEEAEAAAQQDVTAAEAALGACDDDWAALWAGAPFAPLGPDAMLVWLDAKDAIAELARRRDGARRDAAALRAEAAEAAERLLAALGAGADGLTGAPLGEIAEAAMARMRRLERAAERRGEMESALGKARLAAEALARQQARARTDWDDWQAEWHAALAGSGLTLADDPEVAGDALDRIEEMRAAAKEIDDLRHRRIGTILRDEAAFRERTAKLVAELAPDLAGLDADAAARALEERLAEADRAARARQDKAAEIERLEADIAKLEAGRAEARGTIRRLEAAAGVAGPEALAEAIASSDRHRAALRERAELLARLAAEGDGHPPAALMAECAEADPDIVAARMEALEDEIAEANERLLAAREAEREAARALGEGSVGGEAAAAAALRQEALAELEDAAARYAQLRSAAVVLRWAIGRYRQERQAPLLRRAGEIFAGLTLGAFDGLGLVWSDDDRPLLAGYRSGGTVGVEGMSTGTVDQLYLALRVAAVEAHLETRPALPFVADDLFVNFDDSRAAAGFRALASLARNTQVLVFTHHRHLLDVARAALNHSVSVVHLDEAG